MCWIKTGPLSTKTLLLLVFSLFIILLSPVSSFRKAYNLKSLPNKDFLSTMRRYSTNSVKVTRENFWQALGTPKFISAPMVDQSNMAWRVFVRKHGVDVTFTQMVHSRNFVRDKTYRREMIDWLDYTAANGSLAAEEEARTLDRPLIVQLAGDSPEYVADAAKIIEGHGVTAIDLNLGCPQRIAKRGHYGAYLLPEKDLIVRLLSSMVAATSIPITAKIRKLASEDDTLTLVKAIESTGVSMLTVHGRLVTQNKQFTGAADWNIIRKIKQTVTSIPVVANGGISCRADALRCLEYTGVDAVMSSEGILQNPKLFSEQGDYQFHHNFIYAQLQSAKEYLALTKLYPLPHPLETVVRGHLFKMLHRLLSSPSNFDVRDTFTTGSLEIMTEMVFELERRMSKINFDTDYAMQNNLLSATNWYDRHRSAETVHSTPRFDPVTGKAYIAQSIPTTKTPLEIQAWKEQLQAKHADKLLKMGKV